MVYGAYALAGFVILFLLSFVISRLLNYIMRKAGKKTRRDQKHIGTLKVLIYIVVLAGLGSVLFIVLPTVINDRQRKEVELKCNELYGAGSPDREMCSDLN